jgi:hypothetical protein
MDINLLPGTWRTDKVQYHHDECEYFGENDHWNQLQIECGGKITEVSNYKGHVHRLPYPVEWDEMKGQIMIRKLHRWSYLVKELTASTMVVESVDAKIKWFYQRVTKA